MAADPGRGSGNGSSGGGRGTGRGAAVRAVVRPTATSAGLIVAYYLLPLDDRFDGGTLTGLVVGLLAVVALFLWQIRAIARSDRPRLRAVEALATTLPLFVLLFASTYYLLDRATPGSFTESLTRTDALYFALTVVSTVGFGDITARTQTARIMVMLQMTGGILLVGVAARVVVGAVQAALRRRERDGLS